MSRRTHNYLYLGAIFTLLAVVVIGLIPGESAVETDAERAHRIAGELRCPFCSGESIAEAPSGIGSDLRALIDEQVASGMSDDEIFDYYVSVYTERVLLSPPLLGWGVILWLLPVLLLVAGILAVLRRRRRAGRGPSGVVFSDQSALDDAREAVSRDLAELDVQEAAGELDPAAGAQLRSAYEEERDALARATVEPAAAGGGRSRGRSIAGAAVLVGGALALTVLVVSTVRDRTPGDLITGGIASTAQQLDVSSISTAELVETVEAHPDSVPLRLALAARYFTDQDYAAASGQYVEVLNRERHPEALANVGWMLHNGGESEAGLQLVEEALMLTDELALPYWYLANIRYYGFGDAAGAVAPLETLMAVEALPDEFRSLVAELLAEIKAAS